MISWLGLGPRIITDPETRALLEESKQALVRKDKLMIEQDRQCRKTGQEMSQKFTRLKTESSQLSGKICTLERRLNVSGQTQASLQANLAQERQALSQMTQRINSQVSELQKAKGDLEVAHREAKSLQTTMETQKKLLLEQTNKATLATDLSGKYSQRIELEQQVKAMKAKIASKSDQMGLCAGAVTGLLGALLLGGMGGILLGLGVGSIVKSALQKMNILPCTAALHAQKASLEKQLFLVNEEAKRLKGR